MSCATTDLEARVVPVRTPQRFGVGRPISDRDRVARAAADAALLDRHARGAMDLARLSTTGTFASTSRMLR